MKPAAKNSNRTRSSVFAVISVAVLGVAGYLLYGAFARPAVPPSDASTIDIAADMGGFTRTELRVKAGVPVTVRLTSLDNANHADGGGKHQWAVDQLGLNITAPPRGSKSLTFTPSKPGRYTFYCDICCGGRANPTMTGSLVVTS